MEGGRCRGDLTSWPGPRPVGALFQAEPKAGISGRLAPALLQLSVLILGEDCVPLRAGPSSALVRPHFLLEVCACVQPCVWFSLWTQLSVGGLHAWRRVSVCACHGPPGPCATCLYWGGAALTSFFFLVNQIAYFKKS